MNDTKTINIFNKQKILTIDKLADSLQVSTVTARRRLKTWQALTSINKNGRYYTLPNIPEFNEHGIWNYQSVFFSEYGNLKQTIISLIRQSEAGLNTRQIAKIVNMSPSSSFFTQIENTTGIVRKKYHGKFVYFSDQSQKARKQIEKRMLKASSNVDMPTDSDAIVILVELIKYPKNSIEQLAAKIQKKGVKLDISIILRFLKLHSLLKKISHSKH